MITRIPVAAFPNQRFTYISDGNRWEIRLFTAAKSLFCDVSINGEEVLTSSPVMPDEFLLPFPRMLGRGNMFMLSADIEYIEYQKLGVSQLLYYFSKDEFIND